MSHASLLVITDTQPTEDELQEILLPWHEYECTGIERYLVDVDVTDDVVNNYPKHGDGRPLAEFATDWCGGVERDGRYYRRTNPNKRWDWWQVGGRYTGKLSPGYDPAKDPLNWEECWLCRGTPGRRLPAPITTPGEIGADGRVPCNGCPGTPGRSLKHPGDWVKHPGDQARWGSLNLERMLAAHRDQKTAEWDAAEAEFEKKRGAWAAGFGETLREYEKILTALRADMDAGRGTGALYQRIEADPRAARLRELVGHADGWDYSIEGAYMRADHVATAAPITCWAVVKDGRWYENGELGWWGMSSNDQPDWPASLAALLATVRPDQWVTVVDYHI